MGYGSINYDVNPLVNTTLYKRVVLPSFLYGCETWTNLRQVDIMNINKFQHYAAKLIRNFRKQTRSDMCESLLGLPRLCSEVDKRKLMFFQKLTMLSYQSTVKQIFLKRLYTFVYKPKGQLGFIPDVYRLFSKYGLSDFFTDYVKHYTFPTKVAWKRIVNSNIYTFENKELYQRMNTDSDFCRFISVHSSIKPGVVWTSPKSSTDLNNAYYVAKMLTCVPQDCAKICDKCAKTFTDIIYHSIIECNSTSNLRDQFFDNIINSFDLNVYVTLDNMHGETFLETLFGKPSFSEILDEQEEQNFRRICYNYLRLMNLKYLK